MISESPNIGEFRITGIQYRPGVYGYVGILWADR